MKAMIRSYESKDLREVVTGLRPRVFAEQCAEDPEAFAFEWNVAVWRFLESHPLADEIHRWVLTTEGEEVVGHLAALPQYYRIDGRRVVAHTPAEYMVLPGYGFHALSLMRRFFRTCENCVCCDQPRTAIEVETRLGAEVVGKLQYAAKIRDVSRLPRFPASIPKPMPESLTWGLSLLDSGLQVADRVLNMGFGDNLHVEVLEEFDATFDKLFESVAAALPCVPEKDSAFLRWRYGPGSPQSPVTVLGVRQGNALLGYAVLRMTVGGVNGYVLDLTTLPGRDDVARSLLREAIGQFARARVALIKYRFLESPTSPRKRDLPRFGFFFRNKRAHTLLVKFADHGLHKAALDASNWSYTTGDGEASFWVR